MPMLLQLVLLVVVIVVLRNVMGDGSGKGIFHGAEFLPWRFCIYQ